MGLDLGQTLVQALSAMKVAVMMKSTIEVERAGMKYFGRVKFEKSIVIGYYSGTLMSENPFWW